jgi:hypothetical protein
VARDESIVAFGLRGHIFRSTDGGGTWTAVKTRDRGGARGGDLAARRRHRRGGQRGYAPPEPRQTGRASLPCLQAGRQALARALPSKADSVLVLGEGGATEVPLRPAQ